MVNLCFTKKKGQAATFKTKGRPTQEEHPVMDCPKKRCAELAKLKHEMGFKKGTNMLIAVSISSDQMLCHVHMFSETWFMDVTSNLNRLKWDVFIVIVRDACWKRYIGNFTVIPSGQAWVFMKINTFFICLDPLPLARTILQLRTRIRLNLVLFEVSSTLTQCTQVIVTCSVSFMP